MAGRIAWDAYWLPAQRMDKRSGKRLGAVLQSQRRSALRKWRRKLMKKWISTIRMLESRKWNLIWSSRRCINYLKIEIMAILKNGLLGGISGKIGNAVYYMLNGKQVSRVAGKRTKPPTQKELANWQAMKVAVQFIKTVDVLIKVGFAQEAKSRKMQPQNAAVSYIRKYALKGQYPDVEIDYPKVRLSMGNLHGLNDLWAVVEADDQDRFLLRFSWQVSAQDQEWCRRSDQVMLMAYCPDVEDKERACFSLYGAMRYEGQDVLELPALFTGKPVEVYVSVLSADRAGVSNSQYMGRLEVGK